MNRDLSTTTLALSGAALAVGFLLGKALCRREATNTRTVPVDYEKACYRVAKECKDAKPRQSDHKDVVFMKISLDEAMRGLDIGEGGPFGAVIVRNGEIIARGNNRVLQSNDPTNHAEMVAIRNACGKLGRFSLDDCVIYSSCQPCPMCYSAIHWAKIPVCKYTATAEDAAKVGFDDKFLYDSLRGLAKEEKCHFEHQPHPDALVPFQTYSKLLDKGESKLY